MRIIDSIPHPQMKISIFAMNEKYLVKFEAGPYEQTYKIQQDDCEGIQDLKEKISETFCTGVIEIFRNMHHNWNQIQAASD